MILARITSYAPAAAMALSCLAVSAHPERVDAVIERPYPLDRAVADNELIVVARVERLDADRPAMILTVQRELKGTAQVRRIPVLLVGQDATQSRLVVERLAADLPLVLFLTDGPQPGQVLILAYTNGTWFQVIGQREGEALRGGFTHVEPYLRRTFNDSTQKLQAVIEDVLAGRAPAPAIDRAAEPGVGPPAGAEEPPTKTYLVPTAAPATVPSPPPPSPAPPPTSGAATPSAAGAGGNARSWFWPAVAVAAVAAVLGVVAIMRRNSAATGNHP